MSLETPRTSWVCAVQRSVELIRDRLMCVKAPTSSVTVNTQMKQAKIFAAIER